MPVKSQGKWLSEDIISNVQVNWENTYKPPFLYTVETKLKGSSSLSSFTGG